MSIISLEEVAANSWRAKYHGNYGIYTIKIKSDGKKTVEFSCSCPSSYYPCKHIPMIEEAIKQDIAKNAKSDGKNKITVEQLLKDATQKELCDFIIRQAKHNSQLRNAILLEFSRKINDKNINCYTQLLRSALKKFYADYEYMEYGKDYIEIDELDQWLDKAQEYIDLNIPNEAILICKACIEEYASWCEKRNDVENFDISYQKRPFDILNQAISMPEVNYKELFDYCKSEMLKSKYRNTYMDDGFNKLFANLSTMVGFSLQSQKSYDGNN